MFSNRPCPPRSEGSVERAEIFRSGSLPARVPARVRGANYLGATLRIREPHRNGSLASRLPSFLTDRKNRATVVKAIASLEAADLARR
jgi:hypothetical protein